MGKERQKLRKEFGRRNKREKGRNKKEQEKEENALKD